MLVLAFFSSVTTELASTGAAADGAATRQLADAAVNVVMTQLVDGTKGVDANRRHPELGLPARHAAHLYRQGDAGTTTTSSTRPIRWSLAAVPSTCNNEQPPNDWNSVSNSDIYTDLNAPVVDAQGNTVYPILDPGADGRTPPTAAPHPTRPEG